MFDQIDTQLGVSLKRDSSDQRPLDLLWIGNMKNDEFLRAMAPLRAGDPAPHDQFVSHGKKSSSAGSSDSREVKALRNHVAQLKSSNVQLKGKSGNDSRYEKAFGKSGDKGKGKGNGKAEGKRRVAASAKPKALSESGSDEDDEARVSGRGCTAGGGLLLAELSRGTCLFRSTKSI